MKRQASLVAAAVAAALSFPLLSTAQNQTPIYGSQLMTQQERAEYRAHMRSLRTADAAWRPADRAWVRAAAGPAAAPVGLADADSVAAR